MSSVLTSFLVIVFFALHSLLSILNNPSLCCIFQGVKVPLLFFLFFFTLAPSFLIFCVPHWHTRVLTSDSARLSSLSLALLPHYFSLLFLQKLHHFGVSAVCFTLAHCVLFQPLTIFSISFCALCSLFSSPFLLSPLTFCSLTDLAYCPDYPLPGHGQRVRVSLCQKKLSVEVKNVV